MRSCSALGGEASWEHMLPIQKEAKSLQHRLLRFRGERYGSGYVLSPTAWKRRVNQQEIHQQSINCHFHTTISY